ncbi:serine/threonine protein kinase [Nocardiopsis sp. CNR-923]|uniref:serine/threonine-protein kinase n=1 Tax=Nocardiopsis sp. CNR-923 TaxID=1904965 RepID=UPI0009665ACB|nr:serine/threonine-protein kinase [Nocardiopsis sp. CNR-923]OLT29025.1 serine/threonine protein kinase [Nocardiopsis sp. CNR-923]
MSMNSDPERIVADRYVLRRELGRGGMGVVWEAFDPSLDRIVAIKQVLLPDHFTESERADAHARVRREARSAARVSHPTVITVHDVFVFEGDPWVVMELIEGGSLQELLAERGALDLATAATVAESLLRAVRAADEAGVLHRDIKPGNIMMATDGRVVLTDFGIATVEGGPSITRTGALIGSPEYMPPERLEGGPAGHRGDLWSIGVTLFAAVEGVSPFRRDTIAAAIAAVVSAPLPPMTRAGWLEPVITGLLERDPGRRLSADAALALLRERGGGPDARPSSAPVGDTGGQAAGTLGAVGLLAPGPAGAPVPGPAGHPSGPHPGLRGPVHHAPSGGHPAPSTGPRPGGPYAGPGPTTPHPSLGRTPGGPVHPPAAARTGGVGGATGPVHSGGHAGGRGPGTGATGKLLVGLGAGGVVVLLVAVVAAALLVRSGSAPVGQDPVVEAPRTGGPTALQSPPEPTGGDEAGWTDDDPASYDDLTTFRSPWFDVDYPSGWTVDDSRIDDTLVYFVSPGRDHQVLATGWTEQEFHGTSAEYLQETEGGTNVVPDDVTTDYEQLELDEVDSDDFPDSWGEGWDVARVEADFANVQWGTAERRFWRYVINFEYQGHRVFYLVSVNVPREQADDFDDLAEEIVQTFAPNTG